MENIIAVNPTDKYVFGGISVSVGTMSARSTYKLALTFSVLFRDMTAFVTSLRSVLWINLDELPTPLLQLVSTT